MAMTLYQIDAFTDRAFAGNPAAVVLLDAPAGPLWMQQVAAEMNLSETAFVHEDEDHFNLCWFTPTAEVTLCGHATLAAAAAMWDAERVEPDRTIYFQTRSGLIGAVQQDGWIELDLPLDKPRTAPFPKGLADAIDQLPHAVLRGREDYLVELAGERDVRGLAPNLEVIRRFEARGVIVTAPSSEPQYDFVSRFFAPAVGIDEDPVTGSAHCLLAPYWHAKLGRTELIGCQASPRGGIVRCRLRDDRVAIAGQTVIVMRGELLH